MRKSLLLATLALATAAWAQTSGINPAERQDLNQQGSQQLSQQQVAGNDWYNQHLAQRADQFVRINQFVSPAKTEFLQAEDINPVSGIENQPQSMARPGSMAAGEAAPATGYWYNKVVQTEAKFNQAQLSAMRHEGKLSEGQSARNE